MEKNVNEEELIEALKRSGYLFEAEIANSLSANNFFVETNQVIIDPITQKSREIDIIAELYEVSNNDCTVKVRFVFEVKRTDYPFVLINKFSFSPNIEIYDILKTWSTGETFKGKQFRERIIDNNEAIYTQYCSFDRKKNKENQLIAHHIEAIYSGLSKISFFCENECENHLHSTGEWVEKYNREFLFFPVLLISGDLFEVKQERGTEDISLEKIKYSRLLFNSHYNGEPISTLVYIVTKEGFSDFMNYIINIQREIQSEYGAQINTVKKV